MPWNSATIRIRSNHQVPSGPVAFPFSVMSQIQNGPACRRSIIAYNLLGSGLQNNRVAQWNKKQTGSYTNYNC